MLFLMVQLLLPGLFVAGATALPENPDTSEWFAWEWPEEEAALGSALGCWRQAGRLLLRNSATLIGVKTGVWRINGTKKPLHP
ncbi:hypothetical protein DQG13_21785 [Paenibacillus sp. YN15]|nr:hypothetical protein DQG13_21785 [Paenibacillus sp. YN15]